MDDRAIHGGNEDTAADTERALRRKIERLQSELEEQARLLGMSAERELKLRAEVERLLADATYYSQRWREHNRGADITQADVDRIINNPTIQVVPTKNTP